MEPVAPRRDRKALGKRSWHNSYSILSYAIFFYITHLMLPEGILFSTQTPPQASTTPRGEKGVFHHPPYRSYQKSNKIRSKSKSRKAYPKNTKNLDILTILASQTLPKTMLNRVQEASWPPLGPSWALLATKPWKKTLKSAPRDAEEVPNLSQNPPQTSPKSIKKRMQKIHGFWNRFFHDFLEFWFPKPPILHWIFDAC